MLKCAACGHSNPDKSPYCQKCAYVLGVVRQGYGGPATQPVRKPSEADSRFSDPFATPESSPAAQWNWKPFWFIAWFFVGMAMVIGSLLWVHTLRHGSPWGEAQSPLAQHFFEYSPLRYYTLEKCSAQLWTIHDHQQDLTLGTLHHDDSGTLVISTLSSSPHRQTLLVQSADWTTVEQTDAGQTTTALSPEDPSLAPATVVLDKPGYVLKYDSAGSWRLGKALHVLVPMWPPNHQPGDSWNESVEWTDRFDAWEIRWSGILTWTAGVDANTPHARLTAHGKLTPTLQNTPRWARRVSGSAAFDGSAQGEALYDPAQRRVLSNAFHYSGTLTIPLRDLNTVPAYRRFDQYSGESGAIVIVFQNEVAIGLP